MRTRCALVTLCLLVGAPSAQASSKPKLRSGIVLPSAQHCLAKPELTITVRKLKGVRWASATVKVNGKRFTRVRQPRRIRLTKLPAGRLAVSITVRTTKGRTATAKRTYRTCPPPAPTPSPTPTPTPTPAPPPAPAPPPSAQPGSYSGTGGPFNLTLYVSPDGRSVQDITVATQAKCVGGALLSSRFYFEEAVLGADGSFAGTTTVGGIVQGAPVTFTTTIRGHLRGTAGSGTLRLDITRDGVLCTTNDDPWSVTRDRQGADQTLTTPPPGSYSGIGGPFGLTVYVSRDGRRLQDLVVATQPPCTTGAGLLSSAFVLSDVPIAADGSFNATVTESAIVSHKPAKITYRITGNVHGTDVNGVARLAGSLRQLVRSDDGTSVNCDSNRMYWWAHRDSGQALAPPRPGTYSGVDGPFGMTFEVSPDGKRIENVDVPTQPHCTAGAGLISSRFLLASVPIAADGSFDTTATATGVVVHRPVSFTFRLRGHFHGTGADGKVRVAGQLRQTATYTDGGGDYCTTNDRSFWAKRSG